jgi:hypothetical protein
MTDPLNDMDLRIGAGGPARKHIARPPCAGCGAAIGKGRVRFCSDACQRAEHDSRLQAQRRSNPAVTRSIRAALREGPGVSG